MALRKKHLTPIGRHGRIQMPRGKGATEQTLPSRSAMDTLTSPTTGGRTMNNYAKSTPMGAPSMDTPDISALSAASPSTMGAMPSPMPGGPPGMPDEAEGPPGTPEEPD
jgi:hypothetical protein